MTYDPLRRATQNRAKSLHNVRNSLKEKRNFALFVTILRCSSAEFRLNTKSIQRAYIFDCKKMDNEHSRDVGVFFSACQQYNNSPASSTTLSVCDQCQPPWCHCHVISMHANWMPDTSEKVNMVSQGTIYTCLAHWLTRSLLPRRSSNGINQHLVSYNTSKYQAATYSPVATSITNAFYCYHSFRAMITHALQVNERGKRNKTDSANADN